MTRLGCFADLHLGKGCERYGPERLQDQLDVLTRVCELFVAEGVDGVLLAGDLFEGPLPTPEQYVGAAQALRVLGDIPVVACLGNGRHDSATRPQNALDVLAETYGASTVTVHSVPGITYIGDVAVCVLPWVPISRLAAARNGASRDALYEEAAALLHGVARGLREQVDGPAVLLGHWSASGAVTPTGREVGLDFGVVLDTAELEAQGWDAVVLGHIHRSQVLCEEPWIGYVGSPLPLDFGEANDIHGVWILDLAETERGTTEESSASLTGVAARLDSPDSYCGGESGRFSSRPRSVSARFVPLASRSFETFDFKADELIDWRPEFAEAMTMDAIIRLRYTATAEQARRIDKSALTKALYDAGAWRVEIRDEIFREDRARVHVESDTLTELEALRLYAAENGIEAERIVRMEAWTVEQMQANKGSA